MDQIQHLFIEIFQDSISEKSSLTQAFSLHTWTLWSPGPGVSFLLFLRGGFYLPPYNFCSVPFVGLYYPTSLCYLLHARGHSQQTPVMYYSDSEVSYFYDFAGLDDLWDKVPDLRSLDMKMIGVLWIPELEARKDLNWRDAIQTKDKGREAAVEECTIRVHSHLPSHLFSSCKLATYLIDLGWFKST